MNAFAMFVFLRFIQRTQALVKRASETGQIHNKHDVLRCAELTYKMSFDRQGNILVDR